MGILGTWQASESGTIKADFVHMLCLYTSLGVTGATEGCQYHRNALITEIWRDKINTHTLHRRHMTRTVTDQSGGCSV